MNIVMSRGRFVLIVLISMIMGMVLAYLLLHRVMLWIEKSWI